MPQTLLVLGTGMEEGEQVKCPTKESNDPAQMWSSRSGNTGAGQGFGWVLRPQTGSALHHENDAGQEAVQPHLHRALQRQSCSGDALKYCFPQYLQNGYKNCPPSDHFVHPL